MTEKQVTEEVLRYLKDESYNYAILIDGEWGCGKTFFVKNDLSKAIEEQEEQERKCSKRVIKYISLYGCKSILDVQENLAWSFAENARETISKRLQVTDKTAIVTKNIMLTGRKIGNVILKKFAPDGTIYNITSDWLNMSSFIFVFDDLERCDCPINEVFGFLNELVEHEKTKVILVANEEEISGFSESEHLEQQYQLALEDKIDWPRARNQGSYYVYNKSSTISLDELERRRNLLFPVREGNSEYKKIREKLIGVTLRYTPDVARIMKEIISSSTSTEEIKRLLLGKSEFFKSDMDYHLHHNLRTFQFFLSKVSYLLEKLDEVPLNEEYISRIKERIVSETFSIAVRVKSNYQPPRDPYTWLRTEQTTGSAVIKQYVESGEFLVDEFKQDILVMQQEIMASIPSDDPYFLLYQQYYIHTQSWCEEQLKKIIDQLRDNRYPISFYGKIITSIQRLLELGFDSDYLEQAKTCMLSNIASMGEVRPIAVEFWGEEDPHFKARVREVVSEINNRISSHSIEAGNETITKILKEVDWVDHLEKYIDPENKRYIHDMPIFSKASSEQWIKRICEADPEQIDDFHHWLCKLYPRDMIRNSYFEDKLVIKEIVSVLKEPNETDLIKKAALRWLMEEFEHIILTHESEMNESTEELVKK